MFKVFIILAFFYRKWAQFRKFGINKNGMRNCRWVFHPLILDFNQWWSYYEITLEILFNCLFFLLYPVYSPEKIMWESVFSSFWRNISSYWQCNHHIYSTGFSDFKNVSVLKSLQPEVGLKTLLRAIKQTIMIKKFRHPN